MVKRSNEMVHGGKRGQSLICLPKTRSGLNRVAETLCVGNSFLGLSVNVEKWLEKREKII